MLVSWGLLFQAARGQGAQSKVGQAGPESWEELKEENSGPLMAGVDIGHPSGHLPGTSMTHVRGVRTQIPVRFSNQLEELP